MKTSQLVSEIFMIESVSIWGIFFGTQRHVTRKWLVRPGRNSNVFMILWLSWLPASLTKIRSIINLLAWKHHLPILSLWDYFRCSKLPNSILNCLIRLENKFFRDFMPILDICKFDTDLIQNDWEKVEASFSPLGEWEILVAMTTTVLIQSAPKPYADFPPPH